MASLTVYSTNGDFISSDSAVYATARAGTGTLSVSSPNSNIIIGQAIAGTYFCYESFLDFDTSSLGASASISAAVLDLYFWNDTSITNFTITVAVSAWGATLESADFIAGADLAALTTTNTLSTSGLALGAYTTITDVALATNINKTTNTRLLIYSSRHSGNNTPTNNEYVYAYGSADAPRKPRLTITYTAGAAAPTQTHQMML